MYVCICVYMMYMYTRVCECMFVCAKGKRNLHVTSINTYTTQKGRICNSIGTWNEVGGVGDGGGVGCGR